MAEALTPSDTQDKRPILPGEDYVWSKDAFLRHEGGALTAESASGVGYVRLVSQEARQLVLDLVSLGRVPKRAQVTDEMLQVLELLGLCGILVTTDESAEDWEFHDLLFHKRSRLGRTVFPYGRKVGAQSHPPHRERERSVIPLYRPGLDALRRSDPTFSEVVESRVSVRAFGDSPIGAGQLGEFLYRIARQRDASPEDDHEHSSRPYPCGGRTYELEVYPVIQTCEGLDVGIYHYLPDQHALRLVTVYDERTERVLKVAAQAAEMDQSPQVLIVLTSRFERVSTRYASLAYALTLKHVGVLYQTMYLTATAMGLGGCALGGGDSNLFSDILGTDVWTESSVGEFIIGSRPQ